MGPSASAEPLQADGVPVGSSTAQPGVLSLIWSDYELYCGLGGESARTGLAKAPVRFVINTTLRAQVLVRLTCAAPRWAHWFFRSLLTTLHASEIVYGAKIGPGLHLPHPYGIGIGGHVRIGAGVTIGQHVTLGSDLAATGQPEVCDGARVLAGAVVVGPVRIGRDAVVGANCVIEQDVPDGGLAAPARTRIVSRRVNHQNAPTTVKPNREDQT